jgi:hypothetical protein
MPLQTFPVTVSIPEGYEATGEFRLAKDGEWYLSREGRVEMGFTVVAVFILRAPYQFPDWVKPGTWLVQDSGGALYLSPEEPHLSEFGWQWRGKPVYGIPTKVMDFTPPACTDWRTSKRQKPAA